MITTCRFTNTATTPVSIDLNTAVYPLKEFSIDIEERTENRQNPRRDGMWPTYSYEGGMTIHLTGQILANDSDDYMTKRLALISCLRYKSDPRVRKAGDLLMRFDNTSEDWVTPVRIESISGILTGASPGFSEFLISLYSWLPYFIGASTSAKYYFD